MNIFLCLVYLEISLTTKPLFQLIRVIRVTRVVRVVRVVRVIPIHDTTN